MKKYKHKPTIVEAVEVCFSDLDKVRQFLGDDSRMLIWYEKISTGDGAVYDSPRVDIKFADEALSLQFGEYLVRGIAGNVYPIRGELFEQLYEEIE